MAARAASALLLTVLLAAGCAGSDEPRVDAGRLPELVLQQNDLGPAFVQFDGGRQVRADAHPGPRQDPQRFDRVGGWKTRYRRPGPETAAGPLVVESRADLFDDADGAESDLEAYRREFEATVVDAGEAAAIVDAPTIGDGATALRVRQQSFPTNSVTLTLAWRYRNVTASVVVSGFVDSVDIGDAAALARKQQRRIAAAA